MYYSMKLCPNQGFLSYFNILSEFCSQLKIYNEKYQIVNTVFLLTTERC